MGIYTQTWVIPKKINTYHLGIYPSHITYDILHTNLKSNATNLKSNEKKGGEILKWITYTDKKKGELKGIINNGTIKISNK